jgi:carboxyl-terminal processing protease
VVLDLRTNGGGFAIQQLRLTDRLLAADLPVEIQVEAESTVTYRTKAGKKYSGPLAVLIGPATGSAAEVLAAALQDHHRAPLIGRSTAGQVLTARSWPLPGGGEVEVAFADVRRMNGQRIEGVGVMPDIPIMPANAEVRAGRDPALERALTELHAQVVSSSSGSPPRRE